MRHCNKSQTNQGEILDNHFLMAFAFMGSTLKVILLQLFSSLDINATEYRSYLFK